MALLGKYMRLHAINFLAIILLGGAVIYVIYHHCLINDLYSYIT